MRRIIVLLLAAALIIPALTGCGDSPAADDAQTTNTENADAGENTELMTESYRKGREAYHEITGIWMPVAEGFEAEYDANYENKSICFDSHGDRALYEAAKAALTDELGEPEYEDDITATWRFPSDDGSSTLYYDVYYHDSESDGVWVFMNFNTEANEE